MNSTTPTKPDNRLALGYGSAWHLLRCLGWQRDRFSKQIAQTLGATRVTWLDFTRHSGGQLYSSGMPIRDGELKRINFIEDTQVQQGYDGFWPKHGEQQNWDAVGKAVINGTEEWLLVEAKAHPAEIVFKATRASENGGRPMIRTAFVETLQALGYDNETALLKADQWLSGYYQYANRFATLHFLTNRKPRVPARLIFIYFCGDQHPDGKFCPQSEEEWQPDLERVHKSLGLKGDSELEQRVNNIFVNVDGSLKR